MGFFIEVSVINGICFVFIFLLKYFLIFLLISYKLCGWFVILVGIDYLLVLIIRSFSLVYGVGVENWYFLVGVLN